MLQPNDVLAGTWKYTVVDSIGDGATGEVWEVSSPQFTGRLALKLLTHRNPPQSWPEHFEREFNVLSRTRHKHVVRVLDKGTHKTGTRAYPFIVTELIPGKNLEVAMETRATPLDPDEAMELVRQCALGLEHAHTKGVVHRDVKPNNIIWHVEENRAVLIDFGVAKEWDPLLTPATTSGQSPRRLPLRMTCSPSELYSTSSLPKRRHSRPTPSLP